MCFLYRQSISIVYESKFKYIYRYFIKIDRCFCGILQSLPLRKCGLKFFKQTIRTIISTSLPLRKCGLKSGLYRERIRYWLVTSLAEVWIKITIQECMREDSKSLPLRKCGLKFPNRTLIVLAVGHFPCGSVDWNVIGFSIALLVCCHFPCGSVDWNASTSSVLRKPARVTSLAEVWIEMLTTWTLTFSLPSLPLRKCGLK